MSALERQAASRPSRRLRASSSTRPLKVVATFTVLADMVRQVGGGRVHVTSLVGPERDPHAFEPTPDDVRQIEAADIVFASGLGLEPWVDRLITASRDPGKLVVVSAGIQALTVTHKGEGKPATDPHAWNSAANGIVYVRNIESALTAADPEGAASYRANSARYSAVLRRHDDYARQLVVAVPAERRRVLVTHDAFAYFGHAYGVTFRSPRGLSTGARASAEQVATVIEQIKAEHVRTYFVENASDWRLVAHIAQATGALPGGTLYGEALSATDGPAPTYTAMFRYNVDRLTAAMRR